MTTGQKIKALRLRNGLTQEQLAHKLGYKSKATINHIEKDRDRPISIIKNIAIILETSPAYLMGWQRDPEKIYYLFKNLDKIDDDQFEMLLSYFEELVNQNKHNSNSCINE